MTKTAKIGLNELSEHDIKVISYVKGSKVDLDIMISITPDLAPVQFLVWETQEEIQLLTREVYANGECLKFLKKKEDCHKINSFDTKNLEWEKELMYFEKNKNFHKCVLIFLGVTAQSVAFDETEHQQIQDLYVDLIEILAEKRNLTPAILSSKLSLVNRPGATFFPDSEVTEYLLFGKNIKGSLFSHSFTLPIEKDEVFLMVTPGELFNNYEKLLLPFDALIWDYLLITFGCAFGLIFIINLMPGCVQDLVYGKNIRTPAYNVVGKYRNTENNFYFNKIFYFKEHSLGRFLSNFQPWKYLLD
jgi:hypothetical protein